MRLLSCMTCMHCVLINVCGFLLVLLHSCLWFPGDFPTKKRTTRPPLKWGKFCLRNNEFTYHAGHRKRSAKTGFHRNTREYVATILYQVSLQQVIASARIQLCAVAIKSFIHWHQELCYFVLFYPVDLQWMAELYPWPGGISLTNLASFFSR